jgi:hypothetical protein
MPRTLRCRHLPHHTHLHATVRTLNTTETRSRAGSVSQQHGYVFPCAVESSYHFVVFSCLQSRANVRSVPLPHRDFRFAGSPDCRTMLPHTHPLACSLRSKSISELCCTLAAAHSCLTCAHLARRSLPPQVSCAASSRAVRCHLATRALPPRVPCAATSHAIGCNLACRALSPHVPVDPLIPPSSPPPPPVHPLALQSFTMDVAVSLASELAGCGVLTDASASTVVSALYAALSSGGVDGLLPCAAAVILAHASASAAPSPPQPLFAVWRALASMEAGADVGRICLAAVSCWRTLQAEHTAHWCTGWEELLPEVDAAFLSTFGSANGHLLPHQLVPVAAAVLVAVQPSASHSAGVN